MAYVVSVTQHITTTTGSETLPLPAHLENDHVFIWTCTLNNNAMLAPTDGVAYTELAVNDANAGYTYLYYKKAGAGGLSDPTVTPKVTDVSWQFVVIRGASSVATHTSANGTGKATAAALTLTQDPQLVALFWGSERYSEEPYLDPTEGKEYTYYWENEDGPRQGVGYTYSKNSESRTYTIRGGGMSIAAGGDDIAIAAVPMVDDGGGIVKPYPKQDAGFKILYRGNRHIEERTSKTETNPLTGAPNVTTLTNVQTSTSVNTRNESVFYNTGTDRSQHLNSNYISTGTFQTGAGDTTDLTLFSWVYGASVDLSSTKVSGIVDLYKGGVRNFDELGVVVGFGDGTNSSFFLVAGSDSLDIDGDVPFVINTADAATYVIDTVGPGSINWTAVTTFYWGYSATAFGFDPAIGQLSKLGTYTLQGGSSSFPATFIDFEDMARVGIINTISKQGNSQVYIRNDVSIGDGTNDVYFDSDKQSVEFPATYDYANKTITSQVAANNISLTIDASAGSTVKLRNTTINCGNFYKFTVDAGSSASATYDFSGATVISGEVTLKDLGANAYDGLVLSGCNEIKHTSLTTASALGGVTIANSAETNAITVTSKAEFDALQNATFRGNNLSIVITGNHGGSTWTATGMTVSGGTGSYDIQYEGTGTLIVEAAAGSGFSQSRANATVGTLTISAPTVTLTVNSSEAASDIKIFPTGTIVADVDVPSGTTASTTTAGTYDWTVQKAGFLPQRGTGVVLGTSESVTVDVNLVEDQVYDATHGLLFTTNYSYNPTTRIMTIVANQEGRDLYSALIDDFITEASLYNAPFPLVAVGPDRIDFVSDGTTAATIDSGDITFWKGAGMEWEHATTGNPAKKFYSIKSSNTLQASSVVGYTQINAGTPAEATLVSNQVNQVIQYFEDTNGDGTPDYNYTGHLLFKGFLTGYYQARWDVVNDGGITSLESYEYTIAMLQDAIAGASGTQSITITTLTDAPITVGGKSFEYELVDPATSTAEELLAQANYDIYTAVNAGITNTIWTTPAYTAFELPDLIIEAGSTYETEAGYFEGDGLVDDRSGVYVSRSAADHPDVSRFQSNDLTYYTPAVTANGTISNLPDDVGGDTRLQILNLTAVTASAWQATTAYTEGDLVLRTTGVGTENIAGLFFRCTSAGTSGGSEPTWVITTAGVFGTTGSTTTDNTVTWECFALLLYDADPASTGWSDSYIDGEEFASGETARIAFAHANAGTSFEYGRTTASVTTAGFSADGSLFVSADSVYATNALDGSTLETTFSPDFTNDYIVLDTNTDFQGIGAYAYFCYTLTTSQGMYEFWGGVTALDVSNYRINDSVVDIYFDETLGFVKQTDSVRIFRADGTRPAIDPTTGGNGLEINWRNPVYAYDGGGGGFTSGDRATLEALPTTTGATASEVFTESLNANLVE